ncbi:MAG: prepilin-type N-terminal cleavage/methylation domain-containing protein [Patescibacteria group bacterium]
MKTSKAFTLIEVLVASSILFIVSAAVVGLSNSIIQGTAITADQASANSLATEAIELTTKIRNDTVKGGGFNTPGSEGKFIWFAPAEDPIEYGWYQLGEDPVTPNKWSLNYDGADFGNVIDTTTADFDPTLAETITVGQVTYYRFTCIEALAAEADQQDGLLNCNTIKDGNDYNAVIDGTRDLPSECYSGDNIWEEDIYCKFTKPSLNYNRVVQDKLIPDGNAVKVRSIVIWQDKDIYRSSEIATILTNWQLLTQ